MNYDSRGVLDLVLILVLVSVLNIEDRYRLVVILYNVSPERHPWSLRGHWRFLTGVLVGFNMGDVSRIRQGN